MSHKRKLPESSYAPKAKKVRLENWRSDVTTDLDFDPFAVLPLEIISYFLQYFDFIYWLKKLVVVSKRWQEAAQCSALPKQLNCTERLTAEIARGIIAKYRVNTLVIPSGTKVSLSKLQTMLGMAASMSTLVCNEPWDKTETILGSFNQITTLSIDDMNHFQFFPEVKRLKLTGNVQKLFNSKEAVAWMNVQALEINFLKVDFDNFELIKERFPSLKTIYVNVLKKTKEETEKYCEYLETLGKSLEISVICRFSHFFNFRSLPYHEYFNTFGETALQAAIRGDDKDAAVDLFVKSSSKSYERDFRHIRKPQFNFPVCNEVFVDKTKQLTKEEWGLNVIKAMLECRFVDFWKAFWLPNLMNDSKTNIAEYLTKASCFVPPSQYAIQAISRIVQKKEFSFEDIANLLGEDTFKRIAQMTDKSNETLLHCFARRNIFVEHDCKLLLQYCDVNTKNNQQENAATIAFNGGLLQCWYKLVCEGADIQFEQYAMTQAIQLMKNLILRKNDVPDDVLGLFPSPFLDTLLFALLHKNLNKKKKMDSKRRERMVWLFEELVRLGATLLNTNGRKRMIMTAMAMSGCIETFWPIIDKYKFNLIQPNVEGLTPLMVSMNSHKRSEHRFLLEHGANPNIRVKTADGEVKHIVFLPEAARHIDILMVYEADFKVKDEHGNTALNRAIITMKELDGDWRINNLVKAVPLNTPNDVGHTPLSNAILTNKTKFFKILLEAGADVNAVAGPLRQSPFMIALETHSVGMICQLLASNKVQLRLKDKSNRSFVYYLLKMEATLLEIRNKLLECDYGAYRNSDNIEFIKNELATIFSTPELAYLKTSFLRVAMSEFKVLKVIVEMLNIDVNMEDMNGNTMLMLFNDKLTGQIVDYLLSHGANVNHQNREKYTPLMLVSEKKKINAGFHLLLQRKLIAAGASLTMKNMWGLSPVDIEPSMKYWPK